MQIQIKYVSYQTYSLSWDIARVLGYAESLRGKANISPPIVSIVRRKTKLGEGGRRHIPVTVRLPKTCRSSLFVIIIQKRFFLIIAPSISWITPIELRITLKSREIAIICTCYVLIITFRRILIYNTVFPPALGLIFKNSCTTSNTSCLLSSNTPLRNAYLLRFLFRTFPIAKRLSHNLWAFRKLQLANQSHFWGEEGGKSFSSCDTRFRPNYFCNNWATLRKH